MLNLHWNTVSPHLSEKFLLTKLPVALSHIVIHVNCILELPFLQTLKTVQVSGAPLIIWSEICVGKSLWGIGGGDTIWLYCVATVHTSWKLNIMKIYAIVKSQEHHFIYSHKYNMA